MISHTLSFRFCAAGVLALLLISSALICGCLQPEPELLLLQPSAQPTVSLQPAITVSSAPIVNSTENVTNVPGPVRIESIGEIDTYTEMDFPAEVEQAVTDFISGKTANTVNGFLRWESVRSRANQSEATRIREQIGSIDYAVFNATVPQNIRVYFGITGEQAKRFRNESVFSESGYIIASGDPSVVYNQFAGSGRDRDGYLTLCALDLRRGDHVLPVNATGREFLISRGGIWDFDREEIHEVLEFSSDSIPRYRNEIQEKVRIIYTREHP